MRTAWLNICRFFSFWYMKLHLYKTWSRVFRFVWERKYRKVELSTFQNLRLLVDRMGGGDKWVSDSWKALWDAVSSPGRVELIFNGSEPTPKHDLDCDEFAIYQSNVIEKSLAAGLMKDDGIQNPRFFTVMWMVGWKPAGHNVVLLEHPQPNGEILYSYMDYGMPSPKKKNIQEVADMVRHRYSQTPNFDGLAWCAAKTDMTPWITNWG